MKSITENHLCPWNPYVMDLYYGFLNYQEDIACKIINVNSFYFKDQSYLLYPRSINENIVDDILKYTGNLDADVTELCVV